MERSQRQLHVRRARRAAQDLGAGGGGHQASGKDKDKKDEGRVLLVGDSDFVSDGVIGAYGNPLFVLDGAKWLVGDEGITGEVSNENDVPIVHTKKQDQVWFYGSSSWRRRWCWASASSRSAAAAAARCAEQDGEAIMNVRGAVIQGGLAALGLVVAYTTWQREPERAPGEVIVVDVNKSDVQKVRFDDGAGKTVELTRARTGAKERTNRGSGSSLGPDVKLKKPARELRGNEGAQRLWEKFAPLRATRALGALKPDKLKELGLDAPKKKLEVTARGVKHTFDIGTSPFGVCDPYVKDEQDGRVYVLGGGVIGDLESANVRLVDRHAARLQAGRLRQRHHLRRRQDRERCSCRRRSNPLTAKLVNPKTRQGRRPGQELARQGVAPDRHRGAGQGRDCREHGTPEVACKVEYGWHGKPKGFIELGRSAPPAPVASQHRRRRRRQVDDWARTEHTAGWVKLPGTAEEMIKECGKIAAGE